MKKRNLELLRQQICVAEEINNSANEDYCLTVYDAKYLHTIMKAQGEVEGLSAAFLLGFSRGMSYQKVQSIGGGR